MPKKAKTAPLLPHQVKVVAAVIHKGGTGKSLMSIHLAHHIASKGHRTLMVDCDTQGNSSQVFLDEPHSGRGVSALFTKNGRKLTPLETNAANVLLLPSDEGMTSIDGLSGGEEYLFRDNLRAVAAAAGCEYVVIDTPPTLTMGMLAPLVAANFAFSPFKPDSFGLNGVSSLTTRIEQIRINHNEGLVYLGLLINLWNRTKPRQNQIVHDLEEGMGDFLIPHKIGDRASIADVAELRVPVWAHTGGAARVAAKEVRAAMNWILTKMESN